MINANLLLLMTVGAIIFLMFQCKIYKAQRDWRAGEYLKLCIKYNQLITTLQLAGGVLSQKLGTMEGPADSVEALNRAIATLTNLKEVQIPGVTNTIN